MNQQRWLRIIPVAFVMYTIAYVDRTNTSLALDSRISSMLKDLLMDDRMKGEAAGIFFLGYVLLQIPGGYWATRWSARKMISICLVCWGLCAVACGFSHTFRQFELTRFLLGVAESGVYPAMIVLLACWFPSSERARANALWNVCQPLAVAVSAPFTGWLLGAYGWQRMLILEGILPFLLLPIWWFNMRDHPRQAKWISTEEKNYLETTLRHEAASLETPVRASIWRSLVHPTIGVMILICFLHNCEAYGCMAFFTATLKGRGFTPFQYGVLFAFPYALTILIMLLNSWHSDKTRERRGHVALVYILSGTSLILSVNLKGNFWLSYALLCLAIPGPSAALSPFWAIPTETLPRHVMGLAIGLVNAIGNTGGFAGPYIVGWLKFHYGSIAIPMSVLGVGMLLGAALCSLLPKSSGFPSRGNELNSMG